MMYIIFRNDQEKEFHVGDKIPRLFTKDLISLVEEVQADGDELQYILESFNNLPKAGFRRVQRWFGDNAKFIVANW